jgi:hypothetical protein
MAWNLIFHVLIEGIIVSFHLHSDLVVLLLKWIVKLISVIIAIFLILYYDKGMTLTALRSLLWIYCVSLCVYIYLC